MLLLLAMPGRVMGLPSVIRVEALILQVWSSATVSTQSQSHRNRSSVRRRMPLTAVAAVVALLLSACGGGDAGSKEPKAEPKPVVEITPNIEDDAKNVAIDKVVKVNVAKGRLDDVMLTGAKGAKVRGTMSEDGLVWSAGDVLEPTAGYTLSVTATGSDGKQLESKTKFATEDLGLDRQTYPSIAPLDGETVGVGMPIIVTYDLPVENKAAFEKKMKVNTTPKQEGSWYWVSDKEAHYRPRTYWQANSTVNVKLNINSVPAGGGVFGQKNREITFNTGDAHVYRANAQTHQMEIFNNGQKIRTIPITTGKEGFITRSGVKVIIEKFKRKTMNSETIGIGEGDQEYYNMEGVKWALRLTFSGEFVHGAPWSVAQQGSANVSHGCTGMSDENAKFLYDMSRRGDVVETVGTDRQMTFSNGWGDWNTSYDAYQAGSALA